MKANDIQVGASHYKDKSVQPWDYIASNNLGYFEGNVVKYVTRWKDKGGVEDLRKARHYIEKLIELETQVKDETKTIRGFIPWDGGHMPVDGDATVEVVLGCQRKYAGSAMEFGWCHDDHEASNIIAYRVIE